MPNYGITVEFLPLGRLRGDEGYFFRGANSGTASTPSPSHQWRDLVLYAAVIEIPGVGTLLYETGGSPEPDTDWGEEFYEGFPYSIAPDERLDLALERTGRSLTDIDGIIIGHLHADHAGGLVLFRGTQVPVYVHETELKNAFYGAASGDDPLFDQPYLDVGLNWVPVSGERTTLFPGLELIHLPGHTTGLLGLLVHLDHSDPLLFVSDQLIFEDHFSGRPQGWLIRDDAGWHTSLRTIKRIVAETSARIVYGHDPKNFDRFPPSPNVLR